MGSPAVLGPIAEAVREVGELVDLHEPAVVGIVVSEHLIRDRAGARG